MGGSEVLKVLNQNVLRISGLDAWVTARNKACCHSFQMFPTCSLQGLCGEKMSLTHTNKLIGTSPRKQGGI